MKRFLCAVAVALTITLSSCLVIIAEPDLEISVGFAGSSSYDGYYEIDLAIENRGYTTAYTSDYYVQMTGSTGSPISFEIAGPSLVDLEPGETQYVTLYGYSALFVPYAYEIFVEYVGVGGVARNAEASGDFLIGDPGTPNVAYSWSLGPFTYSTDDPGIPDLIYSGQYYETQPGMYSFWYQAWDGSTWAGTYTIYRDVGGAGADGRDYFFELVCSNAGPSFVIRTSAFAAGSHREMEPGLGDSAIETAPLSSTGIGATSSTEGTIGQFHYALEYWRVD